MLAATEASDNKDALAFLHEVVGLSRVERGAGLHAFDPEKSYHLELLRAELPADVDIEAVTADCRGVSTAAQVLGGRSKKALAQKARRDLLAARSFAVLTAVVAQRLLDRGVTVRLVHIENGPVLAQNRRGRGARMGSAWWQSLPGVARARGGCAARDWHWRIGTTCPHRDLGLPTHRVRTFISGMCAV